MNLPQNHHRLMELIGLLREDRLDEACTQELETLLEADPEALRYYVESVDLYTLLDRQQGHTERTSPALCTMEPHSSSTSRHTRPLFWLAAAACLGIVIGLLSSRWLLSPTDTTATSGLQTSHSQSTNAIPEIATLSSAFDCQWAAKATPRYEGQRLGIESLHLLKGIATVRFDSDVRLILEGPTRLNLEAIDRALLHEGKAVFSSIDDLDHFTLRTPFTEIQDEGTEYAVSVNPAQQTMEVHVFDGRVICEGTQPDQAPVHVDAGQARRFASAHQDEAIPLAPLQFIRTPMVGSTLSNIPQVEEWFAYDRNGLVGQNGGRGWAGPWILPGKAPERPETLQVESPLLWPGCRPQPQEGSLLIQDYTAFHRPLAQAIRMDQDATYYLSFLVRKEHVPTGERNKGWAFVTLHGLRDTKIAISPLGFNDVPRVIHNGHNTKAAMRLQDGITYFFACKIQARRHKPDQVFVRIYDAVEDIDAVETATWHIRTNPMLTDSVFTELNIYSKDCHPLRLDGIRIGPTWSSITSNKEH